MKYLDGSFSVNMGESEAYRDNYDRTFKKGKYAEKAEVRSKAEAEVCDAGCSNNCPACEGKEKK